MNNTPSTSSAELEQVDVPVENTEAIQVFEEATARLEEQLRLLAEQEAAIMAEVAQHVDDVMAETEMEEFSQQLAA